MNSNVNTFGSRMALSPVTKPPQAAIFQDVTLAASQVTFSDSACIVEKRGRKAHYYCRTRVALSEITCG